MDTHSIRSKGAFIIFCTLIAVTIPLFSHAEETQGPALSSCALSGRMPSGDGVFRLAGDAQEQRSHFDVTCLVTSATPFSGKIQVVAELVGKTHQPEILGERIITITPPAAGITIPAQKILTPGTYEFVIALKQRESGVRTQEYRMPVEVAEVPRMVLEARGRLHQEAAVGSEISSFAHRVFPYLFSVILIILIVLSLSRFPKLVRRGARVSIILIALIALGAFIERAEAATFGTITATACTITAGNSTCSGLVSWSTTGVTDPQVFQESFKFSSEFSSTGTSRPFQYGTNNFSLYNGGTFIASVSVSAMCSSDSHWSVDHCIPNLSVWGEITAPGCTIPEGANSCTRFISWTTTGTTFPRIFQASNQFGSTASGGQSRTLTYGSNHFWLYDNSTLLDAKVANAVCADDTHWNDFVCVADVVNPTIEFSNNGPINAGTKATLHYNVLEWDSCEITRVGEGTTLGAPFSGNVGIGSRLSDTLTSTKTYRLSCTSSVHGTDSRDTTVLVNPPAVPTLEVSPTTCVIPKGGSTCGPLTVSWTNATTPTSIKYTYTNPGPGTAGNGTFTLSSSADGNTTRMISYGTNNVFWNDAGGGSASPVVFAEATCEDGSAWNGSICEDTTLPPTPHICTNGPVPNHASVYPGDDSGLSLDTPYTHSPWNTDTKCEFRCDTGYLWTGTKCISGSIDANPDSVNPGEKSVISWTTENTNTCTVSSLENGDSWNGTNNSGVYTSALSADASYVLRCDNDTLVDHVTVQVNTTVPTHPPSLTVSPNPVYFNEDAKLEWDTNNGDESLCTLTGGSLGSSFSPIPLSSPGSETGSTDTPVTAETTFKLSCPHGETTFTVRVIPISFEQ